MADQQQNRDALRDAFICDLRMDEDGLICEVIYVTGSEGPCVIAIGDLFANFWDSHHEGDAGWGETTLEELHTLCREIASDVVYGEGSWKGAIGIDNGTIMLAKIAREAFKAEAGE